jgi:hypothetical protein
MAIDASEVVDRHYGAKVTAVEPGGAEPPRPGQWQRLMTVPTSSAC